jgi:DNA replication and repair protein RecF
VHVRWLELAGFRNYAALSFQPDPGLNILVGPNGHGKTSLLEAVAVLTAGRSFRTARLAECVAWDRAEAVLGGELLREEQARAVRLVLSGRDGGAELRGTLCPWARLVTFTAADLGLVTGLPAVRRAYLDGVVAKLAPPHAETCRRYRLVLQQRARLLQQLAGRGDAARLLEPWDQQVAGLGAEIIQRRAEVVETVAEEVRAVAGALAARGGEVSLAYASALPVAEGPAATRDGILAALAAGRAAELRRGLTLAGPHRDDLAVRWGPGEARAAASRGEQRVLALALRLAEAGVVRRRLGTPPVFVLDDVLSELDRGVRGRALAWLAGQGQVLFSTTEPDPEVLARGTPWEIRHGTLPGAAAAAARGAA